MTASLSSASPGGFVYWVSGLSGAGKTTFGCAFADALLRRRGVRPILLDGDELRAALHADLGFSANDRVRVGERNARLAALLADQGHLVVCCSVSLQAAIYDRNRQLIRNYADVLIDVDLETVVAADVKGIYRSVRKGQASHVVGMDIAPSPPPPPAIVVRNDRKASIETVVDDHWEELIGGYRSCHGRRP